MSRQKGSGREYNKLKRGLRQLSLKVSTFGLQSPEMVTRDEGQKEEKLENKKVPVARKLKDKKHGPKLEELWVIRKMKLENGEYRHINSRSMPKEQRKE
eukprot:augustus_masked-scaffold_9-processed-gene-13.17-mRNA-1 protein AED:1.00 eAED:1.00 QI:0/-1/0/0/-1/1/1/0/98